MSDHPTSHASSADAPAALRVEIVVAAGVFLGYLFTTQRLAENLQTASVLALLVALLYAARLSLPWWPWAVVCLAMLAGIVARPLDVPNHHFMLTYTAAALAISLSASVAQRALHLRANARWLLVALFGLATLQRILQPTFMDGSYLGYEITRGGFAGPVLRSEPTTASIVAKNNRAILAFRETPPSPSDSITLEPSVADVATLASAFVVLILAIEVWVCFLFLCYPQAVLTHLSLWAFAITLGVLRQEFTFISVVCLLGLLSCDPRYVRLRTGYAFFALLFAALVLKTLNPDI